MSLDGEASTSLWRCRTPLVGEQGPALHLPWAFSLWGKPGRSKKRKGVRALLDEAGDKGNETGDSFFCKGTPSRFVRRVVSAQKGLLSILVGSVNRFGSVRISLAPVPPNLSLLHTRGQLAGDGYLLRPAPSGIGGGTRSAHRPPSGSSKATSPSPQG